MRFDIESALEVASLWDTPVVRIFTMVDFDPEYGRNDYEPFGMVNCIEKTQQIILTVLDAYGAVLIEDSPPDNSDSSYEDDLWTIKFDILSEDKISQTLELYYYYNIDPFGEWWPDGIETIDVLIHTNHVLDLELLQTLFEERETNAHTIDVYVLKKVADEFWEDASEFYEPLDEEGKNELYYLGVLGNYID